MSSKSSELRICAIGLDHHGFKLRPKSIDGVDFRIDLLSKDEALASNLEYDGIIIPSGVYERFNTVPEKEGPRVVIQSDPDVIRKMEAKVGHHLDRGKWICILVDEVTDRINEDHPKVRATVVNDTDLCKRLLNRFGLQRNVIQTAASLEVKSPAFLGYAQKYAIPKTTFSPPKDLSVKELMTCSSGLTGFVLANQIFFLPFFRNFSRHSELTDPITEIYTSILAYLENPNAQAEEDEGLPPWAEAFSFESEKRILQEQKEIKLKAEQLKIELQLFRKFKGILSQTGSALQNSVEFVLKEFFQFKVKREGEAFRIESDNGELIAIASAQACQGSLQRSMINEVDNLRESLKLKHSALGVLIINDHLESNSLADKDKEPPDQERIEHGKRQNVFVLRAIDLLRLMKDWEDLSPSDRKKEFVRMLQSGQSSVIKMKPVTATG